MAKNQITIEQYIGFEKKKMVGEKKKIPVAKILAFIFLAIFCVFWVSPLVILLFGSLRGSEDFIQYPKQLFDPPHGYTLENFEILFGLKVNEGVHNLAEYPIGNWVANSFIVAIGGTLLYLIVASFAAYAFTFIPFRFSNLLFAILVASMVIPGAATSVGNLTNVISWKLNSTLLALVIPGLGGVYGMYLIKTFFTSIPKDLIESAKMDGYNNFKIYLKIVLPLGKTVLFVQGLFGFMGSWNDLVWPQMLYGVKDNKLWTLQVGMAYLVNNSKSLDTIGTGLAGGVIAILPVFVVYMIAQNKIIEGMASAGIKG